MVMSAMREATDDLKPLRDDAPKQLIEHRLLDGNSLPAAGHSRARRPKAGIPLSRVWGKRSTGLDISISRVRGRANGIHPPV
jgi:hypothetical protein